MPSSSHSDCRRCGQPVRGLPYAVFGSGPFTHPDVAGHRARVVYHRACAIKRAVELRERKVSR